MKVYARQCTVLKVDEVIANEFVKKYHRQGSVSVKTFSLGIFYKDDLLGVVQFCRPRTSEKKRLYTSELVRLCFKEEVRVVGGASKLIKTYIREYKPTDFFTYQVSHEENTSVYSKSGLKFVKQDEKKVYLVSPGKDLSTAKWNGKEIFTLFHATKRGPDALIGTDLGEVFHKNGERKTNIELFEDLGWKKEEVDGDKVYEWVNPDYTFYTYRITASDSDKYYNGVSHIKKKDASIEDCMSDGYFGSGGHQKNNKFKNWKKKHSKTLEKEILKTFRRKSEAFHHEKTLIGDLWKSDPLCLNSREGGIVSIYQIDVLSNLKMKICEIHGEVLHKGNVCCTCTSQKSNSIKECEIHWETTFSGDVCSKCNYETSRSLKNCSVHGESLFVGEKCSKCSQKSSAVQKVCKIHGETVHAGENCRKCISESSLVEKECEIHGSSLHSGDACRKCLSENAVSKKSCEIHGEVKHIGDQCYKCRKSGFTRGVCEIHGETVFRTNGSCHRCNVKKRVLKDRVCAECGNEFTPTSTKQKLCKSKHFRSCEVCSKSYEWHPKKKSVCSASCGVKLSNLRKLSA